MLRNKPHSVQIQPPRSVATDAGEQLPLGSTPDGPTIACQITSISSEDVFRIFGVEQREARLLLCEIAEGENFTVGAQLWWPEGGEWLKVAAAPQYRRATRLAQHAQVLLSRAQFRQGAP